jgi:uncharacterized membrane protein
LALLRGARAVTTTHASKKERLQCAISGRDKARRDLIPLDAVRPNLVERILKDHPDLAQDALISRSEVARYRALYVEDLLKAEVGEITELEQRVADSLTTHETLSENVEQDYEDRRTLGERLSDQIATFGGSWMFIIGFCVALAIWIAFNAAVGDRAAFDPYPYILLNLILSCVAALQAPIIMMSQKRQEAKDRLRSLNDYQINLKAELEIRHLHEKMDHLISKQWQRLAEIQQVQLEMMSERRR